MQEICHVTIEDWTGPNASLLVLGFFVLLMPASPGPQAVPWVRG